MVSVVPVPGLLVYRRIMPEAERLSSNFTVAVEASLLGQLFISRTIFQPRALSSDMSATERCLFTKYLSGYGFATFVMHDVISNKTCSIVEVTQNLKFRDILHDQDCHVERIF